MERLPVPRLNVCIFSLVVSLALLCPLAFSAGGEAAPAADSAGAWKAGRQEGTAVALVTGPSPALSKEEAWRRIRELAPGLAAAAGTSARVFQAGDMVSVSVGPEHDSVLYAVRADDGSTELACGEAAPQQQAGRDRRQQGEEK